MTNLPEGLASGTSDEAVSLPLASGAVQVEIAQPIERVCDGSESDSRRVGLGELAVAGDEAAGSPGVDGKGFITLKAAKSSMVWWFPILEAVAHRAMGEIRERLEWAAIYLA